MGIDEVCPLCGRASPWCRDHDDEGASWRGVLLCALGLLGLSMALWGAGALQ